MATKEFCVSLYPYNGDGQDDALTFSAGERIAVVERPDDGGWWKGEKGLLSGWFPASYVKIQTSSPRIGRATINLPSDWEMYQSPEGRPYYVNKSTRETRWDLPVGTEKVEIPERLSIPNATTETDAAIDPPPSEQNQNGSVPIISPTDFTPPPSPLESPTPEETAPPKEESKTSIKQRQFIINNITFPHINALKDQSLLKPDECSYCDYFWPDRDDQSGFNILIDKHHLGKVLSKEMAEFLKERAVIEESYAKNLQKLSASQLGAREEGTLSSAWKRIKQSLSEEAEIHQQFAVKLREEVEKPLLAYKDALKKEIKKMEQQMADERKQLASKMQVIDKGKQKLEEKRKDMEFKQTSPAASKADLEKAKKKTIQAGEDLNKAVDVYNTMQDQWFQDMITFTLELEKMELNRVNMVKTHHEKYHKLRTERDTQSQKILQSVHVAIENVDALKDSEEYVKTHTTGSLRPVHLELP